MLRVRKINLHVRGYFAMIAAAMISETRIGSVAYNIAMVQWFSLVNIHYYIAFVEGCGSVVELRTLDYENPGSNPGCGAKTLGKCFHSTFLQLTQLYK